MAKTRLLYLTDFDVLEDTAQILEYWPDGESFCLVLNQTVFYPGGGGQPADAGNLVFDDITLPIQELWLDDGGVVIHRVASIPNGFTAGATVHMKVDAATRLKHCRLHSAGHVIDWAVSRLDYDWSPTKGAHFPDMSFVEYETAGAKPDDAQEAIQAACDQLIAAGSSNTIKFMDDAGNELKAPDLGHLQAQRFVAYNDFETLCGGTHVADIAQIGQLIVRKVKKKKNIVKVSYALAF